MLPVWQPLGYIEDFGTQNKRRKAQRRSPCTIYYENNSRVEQVRLEDLIWCGQFYLNVEWSFRRMGLILRCLTLGYELMEIRNGESFLEKMETRVHVENGSRTEARCKDIKVQTIYGEHEREAE